MITHQHLSKAMSYTAYRQLLETLMAQGKTTGHTQSAEYLDYAKINLQRMSRLDKTVVPDEALINRLSALQRTYLWVILTEGWCGDAAQNLPALHALEKIGTHIELKLLLRDENETLMDQYLTNGSRSIPKLICLEKDTLNELFTWGPRPAELQAKVEEMLKNNIAKPERGIAIQKWYNDNKTKSLQTELLELVNTYMI